MADSQPSRVRHARPTPDGRRWDNGSRVIETTCDACGKKYINYASHIRRSKKHFCSSTCYTAARKGSGNPKWRGGLKSGKCLVCGKEFKDRSYTGQKLCSPACRREFSKVPPYTQDEALAIIDSFRKSGLPLYEFAKSIGFSEHRLRQRLTEVVPDDFSAATEASRLKWHATYRLGRNFEFAVRRHLISLGYVCMISPRSMGPADLLAVRDGTILLVQCKHGSVLRKEDKQPLLDLAALAGGKAILAGRNGKCITFWEIAEGKRRRMVAL